MCCIMLEIIVFAAVFDFTLVAAGRLFALAYSAIHSVSAGRLFALVYSAIH